MASRPQKPRRETFYDVLSAAIGDLLDHGFDSTQRVEGWLRKIETAARSSLVSERLLNVEVRDVLMRTYQRTVEGGLIHRRHPDISAFTIERIKPKLRAELDRRILAGASLIKLNREQSIQRTLQRFAGWATSIPIGGTEAEKRGEVKDEIKRGISGLGFIERRVVRDQGAKLVAAIHDIVAVDSGAIAGQWKHVAEGPPAYDSRPDHVAMHDRYFVIRDNWAMKRGLMKLSGRQYTDEVDFPGTPVSCSCSYSYVYSLRDLPPDMVTRKGFEELENARERIASM